MAAIAPNVGFLKKYIARKPKTKAKNAGFPAKAIKSMFSYIITIV